MLATAQSSSVTSFQPPPVPAPRTRLAQGPNYSGADVSGTAIPNPVDIQIRVKPAVAMDQHNTTAGSGYASDSFNLDLDLPSPTGYKAPTVDFPTSPSQLKIQLGPSFYPKEEEPGRVSEDDVSFASSCRAKLDLNFQNGGVRLTKRDDGIHLPVFDLSESEPPSIIVSEDQLEDYIEDFFPYDGHQSVMQRQKSFRKKVQQQLENAATERAVSELSKFETMLSTYEEEDGDLGDLDLVTPRAHDLRKSSHDRKMGPLSFEYAPLQSLGSSEAPESLLDIDAICNAHAPNLMRQSMDDSAVSMGVGDSEESGYFIPKSTIEKLYAVYDSTNFHNLYTLSGELRHILTANEIEEIVANRVHLEKVIDPNVMAALSMPWSLNESSLPSYDLSLSQGQQPSKVKVTESDLKDTPSKTSSISNGFHSRNTSDASDDEVSTTSTPTMSGRCSSGFDTPDSTLGGLGSGGSGGAGDHTSRGFDNGGVFVRGGVETASFRRRIALAKSLQEEMEGGIHKVGDDEEYNSISLSASPRSHGGAVSAAPPETWGSLESLSNLDVEHDDGDSDDGKDDDLCFVRRDSKRFGKPAENDRVVQGLFVETKSCRSHQGTLTRVRVPLNLSQLEMDEESSSSPSKEDYNYLKKHPKKRIPLDASVLRTTSLTDLEDSSQATDADVTLSEVFHSCVSKTGRPSQEDVTIRSDSAATTEEDVTLDLDTPDDMAESILGRLESLSASSGGIVVPPNMPQLSSAQPMAESPEFKSFSVGSTEIQIDLRAIHPYRRVISHGGYFDAEQRVAIILFSGCFLPDRSRREYLYVMDQLFLYVLSSLEELIVDDYILVYLHGATPKASQPSFGWLKRCYQLIDRKLRKNLKGLYLVHPSFWLRTVVALTKPFVSSKFSNKLQFVNTLAELCLELPTEHLVIPEPVLQYDFDQKVSALKRHMK